MGPTRCSPLIAQPPPTYPQDRRRAGIVRLLAFIVDAFPNDAGKARKHTAADTSLALPETPPVSSLLDPRLGGPPPRAISPHTPRAPAAPLSPHLPQLTSIAHNLVAAGCMSSGQDVVGNAVADALSGAAKAFQGAEATDFVNSIFSQVRGPAARDRLSLRASPSPPSLAALRVALPFPLTPHKRD